MNVWPDFYVDGWQLHCDPYNDGDGFDRDWYEAMHRDGRVKVLHVSDFDFQMTKDRFTKLVRLNFPRAPKGNWTSETLDGMPDGKQTQ